jgi:beta-galactosidase GanA
MSKATAENALMERLEDWARSLGDGGITRVDGVRYFPARSMRGLRKAHHDGCLLHYMTEWLPTYRRSSSSPAAKRMADIVKAGLVPWEALLLERNQPWSKEVTDQQRMVLCKVMRDTYDDARREYDMRVSAQNLLARS